MNISPLGTASIFTALPPRVVPGGMSFKRSLKKVGFTIEPGSTSVPTIFSKATGAGVNSKPNRVA